MLIVGKLISKHYILWRALSAMLNFQVSDGFYQNSDNQGTFVPIIGFYLLQSTFEKVP